MNLRWDLHDDVSDEKDGNLVAMHSAIFQTKNNQLTRVANSWPLSPRSSSKPFNLAALALFLSICPKGVSGERSKHQ